MTDRSDPREPTARPTEDRSISRPSAPDRPRPVDLAFDPWYRTIHPRLVAALFLSTGEMDAAAEAADEAMARALERWDQVRAMSSPDGWAFRVAYNVARRRGRRRALEHTLLRRSVEGRPTTIAAPAGEAWDAVKQLAPRQRQVVVLRYVADLPEAQIAEVLGISRGTVSSTLADARRILGTMLAPDTDPDSLLTRNPGPTSGARHDTNSEMKP